MRGRGVHVEHSGCGDLASSVTVLGTLATGVTPAHAAARTGYTLYVSTHANRSHAAKLSHHAVHGKVYVYALPGAGALRVKFYIDDPNPDAHRSTSRGRRRMTSSAARSAGRTPTTPTNCATASTP